MEQGRRRCAGSGVSVNKGVTIGDFCLVSPGLPVIKDVPDHSVYKFDISGILVEKNYRVAGTRPRSEKPAPVA